MTSLHPSTALTRNVRPGAIAPPPAEVLANTMGWPGATVHWLAGDGSARCYYRICNSGSSESAVLMQLPEDDALLLARGAYEWIEIARLFQQRNIPAPQPIAALPSNGALIIDDYGDRMLETEVAELASAGKESEILAWYGSCFEIIETMLRIEKKEGAAWCTRAFDEERYGWELKFLYKNFLEQFPGLQLSPKDKVRFEEEARLLSSYLATFPRYFVHRDFHSRNIMIANQALAIIDFQDARLGLPAYDLASLVYDPYVPLTLHQRAHLLEAGISRLSNTVDAAELRAQLPACLLQRLWKAIGSYGYLTYTLKRPGYLPYVKPAVEMLSKANVFDERWVFLSSELPQRLGSIT